MVAHKTDTQFGNFDGVSASDTDDDEDEPFAELETPEIDLCLGDDDPGVGPWTDDFAD